MPFPNQPRVIYTRNPLVEVICHLEFLIPYSVNDDDFSSKSMTDLHESIKQVFPLFNIGKTVTVDFKSDTQEVLQTEEPAFEFSTLDQNSKVTLTRQSVALTTKTYDSWEEFKGLLILFLDQGLYPQFNVHRFKRLGLRYKSIISKQDLDIEDTSWFDLLNPNISGVFNPNSCIANNIVGQRSSFRLRLDEDKGHLITNFGLVTNNNTKEVCFLLDSDFIKEGDMDDVTAREYMDTYNVRARNFFRWCIKDTLHSALGPESAK